MDNDLALKADALIDGDVQAAANVVPMVIGNAAYRYRFLHVYALRTCRVVLVPMRNAAMLFDFSMCIMQVKKDSEKTVSSIMFGQNLRLSYFEYESARELFRGLMNGVLSILPLI